MESTKLKVCTSVCITSLVAICVVGIYSNSDRFNTYSLIFCLISEVCLCIFGNIGMKEAKDDNPLLKSMFQLSRTFGTVSIIMYVILLLFAFVFSLVSNTFAEEFWGYMLEGLKLG